MTPRPTACREHMPFKGHRTVAEVWAEEARGLDLFAELLAEGIKPIVAAKHAGYQPGDAPLLMRLLLDKLGAQAR